MEPPKQWPRLVLVVAAGMECHFSQLIFKLPWEFLTGKACLTLVFALSNFPFYPVLIQHEIAELAIASYS